MPVTIRADVTQVNIVDYLGDTISHSFTWKEADGTIKQLATWTGLSQLRTNKEDAQAVGSFSVQLANTEPNITITMSASVNAALGAGTRYYDVQLTNPADGYVKTRIFGTHTLTQDVSRGG